MTTAQDEAVAVYREGERKLRHHARQELLQGHSEEAHIALDLAHHVGVEMVRNYRGRKPDEWELPPTEVIDHDDRAREGWRP